MGQNRSPRSRLWTVSVLTSLEGVTTEQSGNLDRIGIRPRLLIDGAGRQIVFFSKDSYRAQTAHAAVGQFLRNIMSTGIDQIHRQVTAISVSRADLTERVSGPLDTHDINVDKEL